MKTKTHSAQAVVLTPIFVALGLLAFHATNVRANTIALDFTGHLAGVSNPDITVGWNFSLSSAVLVTDLGVWDGGTSFSGPPGDGLADPHTVTIWTSTGTFVTSATVPAGTSGTLVDDFRYVSIAQTLLVAGSYVIGAYYPTSSDFAADSATGITTGPEVIYGQSRGGLGNGFPGSSAASNGIFGPNFQFMAPTDGNGVPEGGGTFVLLAIAFVALGGFHFVLQKRRCSA